MLEFVDSDLYVVQDKNNFINPLLQVGSGSGGPKITGSDRIRILIPALEPAKMPDTDQVFNSFKLQIWIWTDTDPGLESYYYFLLLNKHCLFIKFSSRNKEKI